jgi:hypothetical protein
MAPNFSSLISGSIYYIVYSFLNNWSLISFYDLASFSILWLQNFKMNSRTSMPKLTIIQEKTKIIWM